MTDPDLHARASALFVALRDLSVGDRRKALRAAADEDPLLASEVESLLVHDVADGRDVADVEWSADRLDRIGPYEILERIGRGSSGQVFLAEQHEPIHRRVAIKIVPEAALSAELAARFEVERRAMERTEHPNIARILDAGRTDGGLPYLVMEYVQGPPITTYCDQKGLSLLDRIRLVLDVADAVQHAHQCGVIHRDLKPGNILVASIQDRAIPCVLDFGIAKPVAGTFHADTPPTLGVPMGTPAYMAPEQTGLVGVDTRADVYALGAVLYELACGRPPVDASGDPLEVLRRIRDAVPAPASRVRANAAPASVLADLDAILAKALEKSRERRYATAAAFADDLRRLLRREPIEARAPTIGYRTARFVQRNRALVAAGALVAAACVLGILGLSIGLVQANRERAEALRQNESQREINRFLTEDLLAQASPDRAGADVTVLDLLHRASDTIDARFPTRPLVAASVHQALGEAFAELGSLEDAERHIDRALELRRASAGPDDPDTLRSEIARSSLIARAERFDEAEPALRECVARARTILGTDDRDLYTALNDLGVTLEGRGKPGDAVPVLEEALAGRKRVLGTVDRDVLTTQSNLALALDATGDVQRSLAMLLEALRTAEALPDPPRFTVLGLNNNVAATYQDLGREREAAPYLLKAGAMAADALGPDHPATLTIQANLASLEAKLGDPARAIELFEHVVAARTASIGAGATDTLIARHGYLEAVRAQCRYDEAAAGFAELLADVERELGEDDPLAAQTSLSLAKARFDAGRVAEALAPAEWAAFRLESLYGGDHFRASAARDLVARIRSGTPAGD
ncbi:MAG TPA: serine/threonine-protein kinase [Planctomycetota bacterium]|nr:serine/threonine-protein kinase [Planctomycetota bacterium]